MEELKNKYLNNEIEIESMKVRIKKLKKENESYLEKIKELEEKEKKG